MIATDVSRSPLLLTVAIGASDEEAIGRAHATWRAHAQSVAGWAGMQVFLDDEAAAQAGSAADLAAWAASQPTDASTDIWALARVFLSTSSSGGPRPVAPTGVAVRDFTDIRTALLWLRADVLAPRGLSFPLEGTASTVASLCWEADV